MHQFIEQRKYHNLIHMSMIFWSAVFHGKITIIIECHIYIMKCRRDILCFIYKLISFCMVINTCGKARPIVETILLECCQCLKHLIFPPIFSNFQTFKSIPSYFQQFPAHSSHVQLRKVISRHFQQFSAIFSHF